MRLGAHHEVGQFMGAADEIIDVEDTLSQPAEEAGHAVFEDLAARRKQGGAGCEPRAKRDEVRKPVPTFRDHALAQ